MDELELKRTLVTSLRESTEARCQQVESAKLLSEAIKALPEKYRLVIQLRTSTSSVLPRLPEPSSSPAAPLRPDTVGRESFFCSM